jgi:antitoxin (DNA-binding transcriptional repressor) of toxin-antitoxin stability system
VLLGRYVSASVEARPRQHSVPRPATLRRIPARRILVATNANGSPAMGVVKLSDAEIDLATLIDAVASGAEAEIVIERDGKPAARLVPVEPPAGAPRPIRLGLAAGKYPPMDFEAFQAMDAEIAKIFLGEDE